MGFDFDMTAEDIKVFLDEADEQLQVMEAGVLRLEKEGESPEHLQEIFRAAHTLKGSSATLGHRKMAEVTHAMENVLDKLRKGKLAVSTAVVDTLFACLDVLMSFKEEIATGEEGDVTTEGIISRLGAIDQAATGATAPVSAAAAQGGSPVAPGGMPPLSPAEEGHLRAGQGRGLTPVWLLAAVDKNASMPAVRTFQLLLAVGDAGEAVRSWPTLQEVEEDKLGEEIKALFLTGQRLDAVRTALAGVPEIQIIELTALASETGARPAPAAQAAAAVMAYQAPEVLTPAAAPAQEKSAAAVKGGKNARTVRVDVDVMDNLMSLVGELVIDRTRLLQVLTRLETEREGDDMAQVMSGALAHIGRMTSDLQDEIQRARMLPVDNLFRKFPRMVRDVAQKAVKEIEFVILGEETELDRSVIEEIGDPLMHLLRNSVDHGVEPAGDRLRAGKPAKGTVTLEAFHEENYIIISVRDDGRGMDPQRIRTSAVRKGLITEDAARRMPDHEVINLVWAPGFSTAEQVSDISGRGVGLDVVQKNIEKLNGSVEIRTEVGKGTEFRVKLPLTLAIIRSLQVQVLDTTYCMPLSSVVETDRIPVSAIQTVRQREVIVKRGEVIPILRLIEAFELERPEGYVEPDEYFVVIVSVMGKQIGIVVDTLIGEGDVVIKPLGTFIGDVPGISGATIMGDGDVAIILDISSLINTVKAELNRTGSELNSGRR
ncbi:MAG: CheA signal transduction histidine kinase [Firmicutes bacterium]|nr:CheA signal transduction histidine kinase [Bacillota bacterium]